MAHGPHCPGESSGAFYKIDAMKKDFYLRWIQGANKSRKIKNEYQMDIPRQ